MSALAVITPSFGPDAELFADLHRSVLEHTAPDTVHHVIVPDAHRGFFERYRGPRCRVWHESELLPRRYRRLRRPGVWVNLKRPWPPVRGWVMQQALKIAATAAVRADAVLIADSDVVLVRPTGAERFRTGGRLQLYKLDGAVHDGMERHIRWHQVAHRLLGLDPPPDPPLADYVSSLNFWDPAVVRDMQERITETTGRHWLDAFTAELHISEFILYGVFVERVLSPSSAWPQVDPAFCHNYWAEVPLDVAAARAFAEALPAQAIGMMISAKSHTPDDARQAALRRCAEVAGLKRT
jgi:Family of unknown function (DUF6492)